MVVNREFGYDMTTPTTEASSNCKNPSTCKSKIGFNPLPDGGLLASAITLCKATLGAGSLALPGSMMSTGIPLSIILLIGLGILSMISINMIVRAQTHSRMDTFEELVRSYFNNLTGYLFEVAMVIFCFGTAVAYLITVGDLLIPIFIKAFGQDTVDHVEPYAYPFVNRPVFTVIVAAILLPLCLVNRINNIRWVSMAGVLSIFILAICVFYVFVKRGIAIDLTPLQTWLPTNGFGPVVGAISGYIFAYVCQVNVPQIYAELKPQKESSMRIVSVISVSLCFVTYLTIGIFGFLTYGPSTQGSIVKNMTDEFNNGDIFVTISFILMALAVLAAYPLNIFPIRASVKATIRGITGKKGPFSWWVGPLIVIISIILSVVVAIYLPDVQTVLYFVGSVTGSYIVYVVPGGFCVRLLNNTFYTSQAKDRPTIEEEPTIVTGNDKESSTADIKGYSIEYNISRCKYDYPTWLSWSMIILGFIFFIVGSYQSVVDVIDFYSS